MLHFPIVDDLLYMKTFLLVLFTHITELVHPSAAASTYAGRYDMHDLPPCVCAGKKEGNLHQVGIEIMRNAGQGAEAKDLWRGEALSSAYALHVSL